MHHQLPRETTPTWEVELLISGVAVFAMLQLPGMLDDALFALLPRFDPEWMEPARLLYIYLKSVAVILAATFAVHLLLRARWIALVGMHSVYPDGVLWDRMRMGPIQRTVAREQQPPAAATIDIADNRATVVFAVGVMMATILLVISLMVTLLFVAGLGLREVTHVHIPLDRLFALSAALIVLPLLVAIAMDRIFGARLAARSPGKRLLTLLFRIYGRLGFGHGNTIINLLASHGGERRSALMMFAVFMPIMLGIIYSMHVAGHPERFGSYTAFPQFEGDSGRLVDAAHYDRMRDIGRDPAVPYIQDLIPLGPYVSLVVPYRPGDDDAALLGHCPQAVAADAVIDCLQQLHGVRLDGKPLPSLRFDAGSDARTDRPALMAMIDVRGLAPGRHELRVARTGANPDKPADGDYVIPFWR